MLSIPLLAVRNSLHSRQPCGAARISVVDGIENQFDPGRNTNLVEDTEEVLLDCVLAEIEFSGDVAIAEAFGDERNDLFFARGEKFLTARIQHTQRWDLR